VVAQDFCHVLCRSRLHFLFRFAAHAPVINPFQRSGSSHVWRS
jgi:hypothetical protein